MKLTTESGYEIEVTPTERYPEHWFIANAFNPILNTSCWGHGDTKISALNDCIESINEGKVFSVELTSI